MNYFAHESAAARYAQDRPYFHPLVIGKMGEKMQLDGPLAWALDVGCGTGQSTLALREIACRVVGSDVSEEMLGIAPRHERLYYVRAAAEHLPFAGEAFDLITVALAFHWLDRERFLAEARRLLRPGGWLVLYNNWWTGCMRENPDFEDWTSGEYITRYPSPPRNRAPFTDEDAQSVGFRVVERERFTNDVSFTVEEVVRYLMTQSNIIAAVEQGAEKPDDVYSWLKASIASFFSDRRATFPFGGIIEYFQKENDL